MEKKITCIICPAGCLITAFKQDEKINISGNGCEKGEAYAIKEYVAPERMVTSLIMNKNGVPVPVKTQIPVPKERIYDVLRAMRDAVISGGVKIGDTVIPDVCGLGVNIVATANVDVVDK